MKSLFKLLVLVSFIFPFACEAKISRRSRKPYVVNLDNCHELRNPTKPFVLVLRVGEKISESVIECAQRTGMASGTFFGLGAVTQPQISVYSMKRRGHHPKVLPGLFELASLTGFVTIASNKSLVTHMHAVISDHSFKALAGHLVEATVGVTVEITIIPMPGPIYREFNEEFQLELVDPAES